MIEMSFVNSTAMLWFCAIAAILIGGIILLTYLVVTW
jgi:hypothetical protein